ncbi:MAG: glycosyltransferase family 4 protein [Elusimicrobia bacterium]|nr:glycosyltransferase family 4 protein [Elusimicrobiota bacterium]
MNPRIKVIHIITQLELGGAQKVVLSLVTHLDRDRFEATLTAGEGGLLDSEVACLPDIRILFVPSLIRPINGWDDLKALWFLWRVLRRERPLIVHTHSSKAGILGRWAAWLAHTPVIVHTYHGFGFSVFQRSWGRWLAIALEQVTAHITTALIMVSENTRKTAERLGIGVRPQHVVIHVAIPRNAFASTPPMEHTPRQQLGLDEHTSVVTMVGNLKPQKNPGQFVKVAARVIRKFPHSRWLFIGDGELRPTIETLIRSLRLERDVQLLGWRRDIREILAITQVFVLTSLWEGLPLSLLEAMMSGLPVVCNAVDGVQEVVQNGENGFLVTPHDVASMADRIVQLLTDRPLARRMGEAGRTMVSEQFDVDHMVCQHETLYLKLVAQRCSPQ